MEDSEIKNFFKDQTIFITGGTGFLGKVLIEKLLRLCVVRKIFVLVRPKKGKTTEERLNDFFSYVCFDCIRKENLNLTKKVSFIDGDCELPDLGITEEFKNILIQETTVVFHAAANVKFDQPIDIAAKIIVRATRDVLCLAQLMPNIKAFVYVSTAFSHCPRSEIQEKFYDPPITYTQLINFIEEIMDKDLFAQVTPKLIGKWPNTYTFAKSIAEDVVRREGENLPVAIFRPGIVTSTADEPVPGWIDNFYGIAGISVGIGLGVLKSACGKKDNVQYIVPCDYVANAILATAWTVSKESLRDILIYNFVGHRKNLLKWGTSEKLLQKYIFQYPLQKMLWYNTFKLRESILWHKISVFLYQTVIAYLVDFVLVCSGRKPLAVQSYKRIGKTLDLTAYFSLRKWVFNSGNVEKLWVKMNNSDKRLFDFNMETLDWERYVKSSVIGGKIYLLKESMENLHQARTKLKMLRVAHYSLLFLFYILMFMFFKWIVSKSIL